MKKTVCLSLFCLLAAGQAIGQQIRLSGSELMFPKGNVIGATFSNNLIFIQQLVTRLDGTTVRASRRVLSWSLTANSVVKSKTLGADSTLVGDDCGRVEVSAEMPLVLICEDSSTLSVLDPDTLNTISTIRCDGYIYDFALDHALGRVFVAWRSASDIEYLTTFTLVGGAQLDQTQISSGTVDKTQGGELGRLQVVADSRTRRVAIAQSLLGHAGYTTNLYGCSYTGSMTCEHLAKEKQVGEIAIWGSEIFLADGSLADDRRVCLTSVNLNNGTTTRQYCAPRTGVHYGVGIIDGRYIIGYTGASDYVVSKEVAATKSSSVSVWRYENGTSVADALQNGMGASPLGGVRIACSRETSRFLLYSETSNIAYIYSIEEPPAPR